MVFPSNEIKSGPNSQTFHETESCSGESFGLDGINHPGQSPQVILEKQTPTNRRLKNQPQPVVLLSINKNSHPGLLTLLLNCPKNRLISGKTLPFSPEASPTVMLKYVCAYVPIQGEYARPACKPLLRDQSKVIQSYGGRKYTFGYLQSQQYTDLCSTLDRYVHEAGVTQLKKQKPVMWLSALRWDRFNLGVNIMNTKKIEAIIAPQETHFVGDGFRVHNFVPGVSGLSMQRMNPFILLDYNSKFVFPPSEQSKGVDVPPTLKDSKPSPLLTRGVLRTMTVVAVAGINWMKERYNGMTAAIGILHKE
ncbi:hypothetical protein FQR65_LT17339 [Abscondita terminalis]|nr:hypothetical protein FQR65_LT17339 [Abscondita terminalis]